MREPVFTETMQIALVVRDLEATMRTYVHEYGIGPWEIYEFNPETVTEMVKDGEPAEYAFRLAVTMVGSVQWELIEPLDDRSMYAEFLAEKGEGVHHVAVGAPDYGEALDTIAGEGAPGAPGRRLQRRHASRTCRPTRISASSRRSSTGRRASSRSRTPCIRDGDADRGTISMTARTRPPFRADHVGSLLRPPELLQAREDVAAGRIDGDTLRGLEDDAIREVVRRQEEVGLQSVTDGELRRASWHMDFIYQLDGISKEAGNLAVTFHNEQGDIEFTPAALHIDGKLGVSKTIFGDDFGFLRDTATTGVPKLTIPSPSMVHYRGGRAAIDPAVYPELDAFWSDLTAAYREEVRRLGELGCTYLQLDDTSLAYMNDPHQREHVASIGGDPRAPAPRVHRPHQRGARRPAGGDVGDDAHVPGELPLLVGGRGGLRLRRRGAAERARRRRLLHGMGRRALRRLRAAAVPAEGRQAGRARPRDDEARRARDEGRAEAADRGSRAATRRSSSSASRRSAASPPRWKGTPSPRKSSGRSCASSSRWRRKSGGSGVAADERPGSTPIRSTRWWPRPTFHRAPVRERRRAGAGDHGSARARRCRFTRIAGRASSTSSRPPTHVRRDDEGSVLSDTRAADAPPEPGAIVWITARPPHTVENVDNSEIRLLNVELKHG